MTKPMTAERLCVCCRYPIHPAETGLRHYGNGAAHSDDRCIWVLGEEIRKLKDHKCGGRHTAMLLEDNQRLREEIEGHEATIRRALEKYDSADHVDKVSALMAIILRAQLAKS